MSLLEFDRARRILAREGVVGLGRRAARKSFRTVAQLRQIQAEYERRVTEFDERTRGMKPSSLPDFYWYHTIDLGDGLVTPGAYDYRDCWSAFGFPEDMTGMKVLDVGSATGFFAFEFAKRGARVVSVELPSLGHWDMIWHEREQVLSGLMEYHNASTPEEAHFRHLEGPFSFCRDRLGLDIERCYSTVYELTSERLSSRRFDLIFAGDVLLHLFSPLKALDVLAPLCEGTLVVTVERLRKSKYNPVMFYLGNEKRESDRRSWWMPSGACLQDMLERMGFDAVTLAGSYSGVVRRDWHEFHRDVFHAKK